MQKHLVMLVVCGLMVGTASRATAQAPQWADRVYFGLNFAAQSGSTDLNGERTFTIYEEQARLATEGRGGAGPMIDLSVGAYVWRNVSVGIGFNKASSKDDATISGAVPHPLFFSRPRNFSDTVPALNRDETAVHLQFGYTLPINEKLDVMVYAGPSFFRVGQDVVSSIDVAERGFPFDAVLGQATVRRQNDNPVGGHIGADATYKLYTWNTVTLGAGGFFRYAGSSTDLRVLDTDVKSDVGGAQVGFGVRVRY